MPVSKNGDSNGSIQINPFVKMLFSAIVGAALGMLTTYSTAVSGNGREIVRLVTVIEGLKTEILTSHAHIERQLTEIKLNDADIRRELNQHLREDNR